MDTQNDLGSLTQFSTAWRGWPGSFHDIPNKTRLSHSMSARSELIVIQRSKVNFTITKIKIIQSHKLGDS